MICSDIICSFDDLANLDLLNYINVQKEKVCREGNPAPKTQFQSYIPPTHPPRCPLQTTTSPPQNPITQKPTPKNNPRP